MESRSILKNQMNYTWQKRKNMLEKQKILFSLIASPPLPVFPTRSTYGKSTARRVSPSCSNLLLWELIFFKLWENESWKTEQKSIETGIFYDSFSIRKQGNCISVTMATARLKNLLSPYNEVFSKVPELESGVFQVVLWTNTFQLQGWQWGF